jgi:hypothetical protein
MSYEKNMLAQLAMPTRDQVERALLKALLKHGGVIREFGAGEEIVDELADVFSLNELQRHAYLQTTYRKENRVKKSSLWHRLLFRSADSLAKAKLVSRPSETCLLTRKREWMLTEKGIDKALRLSNIPLFKKSDLPTKSYEVQKIAKRLRESRRPEHYVPIDNAKRVSRVTREFALRVRGFRQAVIELYNFRCAMCGLRINSPDSMSWEVEAAHIVPHRSSGRDDIWNGLALCRLHHWAFDVGWLTLRDDLTVMTSPVAQSLPLDFGKIGSYDLLKRDSFDSKIILPESKETYPHQNAIRWHRQHVFYQIQSRVLPTWSQSFNNR